VLFLRCFLSKLCTQLLSRHIWILRVAPVLFFIWSAKQYVTKRAICMIFTCNVLRFSVNFLPVSSSYCPQYPVLKHPPATFIPYHDGSKFETHAKWQVQLGASESQWISVKRELKPKLVAVLGPTFSTSYIYVVFYGYLFCVRNESS
jgi:hypothetical protein